MIKLIASDMDGTLLDENGNLPKDFFEVVASMKSKNILFAAASGRQYYTLARDFNSIKSDMIFIAENGTFVIHENKELFSCTIDKTLVEELITFGRTLKDVQLVLCGKKSAYIENATPEFKKEVDKYYARNAFVEDLTKVEDDILKFTIFDFQRPENNSNKYFYPVFKSRLKLTISGEHWLDITHSNANKGEAIKYIQKKLNILPKETMAFGDYFNDVEMLQNAYHSYAMANAPDGVKIHARNIARSNSENGVLHAIRKFALS